MYESYWDLSARPFEATTEREFYYPCESHQGAMLKLRYAIENRKAAAVLAGPAGTGKTLLISTLRQQLDATFRPFVHVVFPQMPGRDLLAYLAEQLGAPPVEAPTGSIEENLRRIEFVLRENCKADRHTVIAVDEAHLLEREGTLQTLQLLTNIQHEGRHCVTILLAGLAGLITTLARLPAFDDRVAVKALLRPLTADETAAYVQHRMAAAGASREIFAAAAVQEVFFETQGVPRAVDRLCDLALLVGYAAGDASITTQQIEAVGEELVSVAPE